MNRGVTMRGEVTLTVAEVRQVARDLAAALGPSAAAEELAAAAGTIGDPALDLLALRQALIATRPEWEELDPTLARRASRTLREAKRLAIEM
jgi:hypothetical protein